MKIELTEIGEGQFIEIKDPKRLKWGEQKAITSALKDDTIGSQLDVAERIAIALVRSGHVLDDDNKPIEFPLTEQSIGDVPALAIEKVAKAFADARTETAAKN